jgi:hypothetical protein
VAGLNPPPSVPPSRDSVASTLPGRVFHNVAWCRVWDIPDKRFLDVLCGSMQKATTRRERLEPHFPAGLISMDFSSTQRGHGRMCLAGRQTPRAGRSRSPEARKHHRSVGSTARRAIGGRMATKLYCTNCGNRVENKEVIMCAVCHSIFAK